jgi:hypothetical protein
VAGLVLAPYGAHNMTGQSDFGYKTPCARVSGRSPCYRPCSYRRPNLEVRSVLDPSGGCPSMVPCWVSTIGLRLRGPAERRGNAISTYSPMTAVTPTVKPMRPPITWHDFFAGGLLEAPLVAFVPVVKPMHPLQTRSDLFAGGSLDAPLATAVPYSRGGGMNPVLGRWSGFGPVEILSSRDPASNGVLFRCFARAVALLMSRLLCTALFA